MQNLGTDTKHNLDIKARQPADGEGRAALRSAVALPDGSFHRGYSK